MQRTSLLILFSFLAFPLIAQDPGFSRLNGVVMGNGKPVPDVHVMNTSLKSATITDSAGRFTIRAGLGDTLLFSAVQYRRRSVILNREILSSKFIRITLEPFVNELDEVVVRPFNLSGDLANDINSVNTDNVVSATIVGLPNPYAKIPTQAERVLFEATSGSGLVPLNPVINAITGRTRYLKSIVARERKYSRTQRVREFYADSLYVKNLKIPEEKIDDFMYFCEVDDDFGRVVDTRDRLRIWEFLKSKSLIYRKNNAMK